MVRGALVIREGLGGPCHKGRSGGGLVMREGQGGLVMSDGPGGPGHKGRSGGPWS